MKKVIIFLLAISGTVIGTLHAYAEEVLMVMLREKSEAEIAFEERLKTLRPGTTFKYVYAGEQEVTRLATELRSVDLSKINLVYTFGTTSSQMVKTYLDGKIPLVFNFVSDPVESGLVKSYETPGENVTGVQHIVDFETQIKALLKMKNIKTLGAWFNPKGKQTTVLLKQLDDACAKLGVTLTKIRMVPDAPNSDSHIQEAVAEANKNDALLIVPSSAYLSNAEKIFANIKPSLLVITSTNKYVGVGGTVALAASYKERGTAAADIANKIFSGTSASNIPVDRISLDKSFLYVDKKRAEAAGLKDLDKLGFNIQEK